MSKTILVVDDHATIRQMVRYALQLQNHRVIEAVDGEDALDVLSDQSVDLLVTDWKMPRLNGIELIRAVRDKSEMKDLPVIVISCEADRNAQSEARKLGALLWLKKPFRMVEIQSVIESALAAGPLHSNVHSPAQVG
jgi:two-component system chemotaxis response regulator CheY